MRRWHFRWWSKFNFILSAGLDSGTILSALVIFFSLQLPKSGSICAPPRLPAAPLHPLTIALDDPLSAALNWWGNTVFTETADWAGVPWKTAPPEGFGPTSW